MESPFQGGVRSSLFALEIKLGYTNIFWAKVAETIKMFVLN